MKILALNPYHGGSHKQFLDGWIAHSRHEFTLQTLPAYKWKWRMRHGAVTLAEEIQKEVDTGSSWDVVFCTDMLNLAEFRGLCPESVRRLPAIVYFHENQLTYPNREDSERDLHFAFTNLSTALSADRVWFNSAYHRDDFLGALEELIRRMPDFQPFSAPRIILEKSGIHPPGIEIPEDPGARTQSGPLHILWVSRWEHDKDPQTFFDALALLQEGGIEFRLSVLGESFGEAPPCFAAGRARFSGQIEHWGWLESRRDYQQVLHRADVVVSTALHEFFGIAVLEAVAAGCVPLVPNRVAYPEVLGDDPEFYHDGAAQGLCTRLTELSHHKRDGGHEKTELSSALKRVHRFSWNQLTPLMDTMLEEVRG